MAVDFDGFTADPEATVDKGARIALLAKGCLNEFDAVDSETSKIAGAWDDVASKKYNKLTEKSISVKELENYDIIVQKYPSNSRKNADDFFKENKLNIIPKMNIASSNLLTSFIKMGYGIGYVTDIYVKDELDNKEIYKVNVNVPNKKVDFGIITLKNNILFKDCNSFINLLINNN